MKNSHARARGRSARFGRARVFLLALACGGRLLAADPAAPVGPPPQMRTLRLLVLVDASYQAAHLAWKPRLERVVHTASAELESRLGLRLTVAEILPWVYAGKLTGGRQAWQLLARTPLPSADLVLGFTATALPKPGPVGRLELGNASAFGRQALVSDSGDDEALAARVLVHELGHVFGAFHVADPKCVMQPAANSVPSDWQFSPPVAEIWRLTLPEFDPRRGVESVSEQTLARVSELFTRHRRPDESAGDNPAAQGYAYRAILALAANRRPRARLMAHRALGYAAENVAALQVLGEAALRDEDWRAAADWLARAQAFAPSNSEIQIGVASARWRLGELPAARDAAAQALSAAPNSPAALLVSAHCARLDGDLAAYEVSRAKLTKISPQHAKRLAELASTWSLRRYAALARCRAAAEVAERDGYENSLGMKFANIPAPQRPFAWSSPVASPTQPADDRPTGEIRVSLGRGFWLGATEVTHDQFSKVMGRRSPGRYVGRGGEHPVEQVTWDEAQEFCRRLSEMDAERRVGADYRLPTEAQWQWACFAGASTREFFGDELGWLADYAWLTDGTHSVGIKTPSPWGLYDMLGNVAEWCHDWYAARTSASGSSVVLDPVGPAVGSRRVVRGGSADSTEGPPRGADRQSAAPSARGAQIGFRVVLVLPDDAAERGH